MDQSSVRDTVSVVLKQLNSFWSTEKYSGFEDDVEASIADAKKGFEASTRKYFLRDGFSVLNTSIYSIFLYRLSHRIGVRGVMMLSLLINYIISTKS